MTTTHKDVQEFEGGLASEIAVNDVHATTPTEAELITSFGAAANKPAGWFGFVNDAGGEAVSYIVWTTGTKYFFAAGTLAA